LINPKGGSNMEHKIINCTVSEEYIIGAGECIGRAGSHDETALVLEFRDIWRGLSKTLFWTNADGTNGTMQILTPDMLQGGAETYRVPVPYGAKTRAGWAKLTIRGVMVEGETETVCAVAEGEFEVMEAEMPEDYREQLDIDATAAEQIMQGIENIKGDILTAVDSAKAAEDAAKAAATSETNAEKAAENAGKAADAAESYTINPPKPIDGYWYLWDGTQYIKSGEPSGGNGATGANGLTPYIKDGYWWIGEENTNVKAEGKDGKDGADGYTPVKGVDYFDGKDGAAGAPGYTPIKGVDYFDGQPGKDGAAGPAGPAGAAGAPGYTPVKGVDYFTATDKAAIVQDVLAALPYYDGDVTISGGVELISFTIDGDHYEAEDGMTWLGWVGSSYNTEGFTCSGNNSKVYYSNNRYWVHSGVDEYGSYTIVADKAYELRSDSGSSN
jgi:hypothetical protein